MAHCWPTSPRFPVDDTFARSLSGLATSVREVIILMADLDDGATSELTFTYEVSDAEQVA